MTAVNAAEPLNHSLPMGKDCFHSKMRSYVEFTSPWNRA